MCPYTVLSLLKYLTKTHAAAFAETPSKTVHPHKSLTARAASVNALRLPLASHLESSPVTVTASVLIQSNVGLIRGLTFPRAAVCVRELTVRHYKSKTAPPVDAHAEK